MMSTAYKTVLAVCLLVVVMLPRHEGRLHSVQAHDDEKHDVESIITKAEERKTEKKNDGDGLVRSLTRSFNIGDCVQDSTMPFNRAFAMCMQQYYKPMYTGASESVVAKDPENQDKQVGTDRSGSSSALSPQEQKIAELKYGKNYQPENEAARFNCPSGNLSKQCVTNEDCVDPKRMSMDTILYYYPTKPCCVKVKHMGSCFCASSDMAVQNLCVVPIHD